MYDKQTITYAGNILSQQAVDMFEANISAISLYHSFLTPPLTWQQREARAIENARLVNRWRRFKARRLANLHDFRFTVAARVYPELRELNDHECDW